MPDQAGMWNEMLWWIVGGRALTRAARWLAGRVAGAAERLLWTSWSNYPKVVEAGNEYAKIGQRLYTKHAVDRMLPRGLGGRGMSPNLVEDVIRTGSTRTVAVKGVGRAIHASGTAEVVTEQGGRIVVTLNPFSGAP